MKMDMDVDVDNMNEDIEEKVNSRRIYDDDDDDDDISCEDEDNHKKEVGSFQGGSTGGSGIGMGSGAGNRNGKNDSSSSSASSSPYSTSHDHEMHERNKKKYGIDYKNIMDSSSCNNFDTAGSIDIELILQHQHQHHQQAQSQTRLEGEVTEKEKVIEESANSLEIKPIKNQMSLFCYVPPKCGKNAFASFTGKSGFLHQRGYADTTLSLGYHLFGGNTLLCDWHTQDGASKMSYGVCHTSSSKRCTYTEAKIYYPPSSITAAISSPSSSVTTHDEEKKHPSIVLRSSTDVIPDKIRGHVEMKFSTSSSYSSRTNSRNPSFSSSSSPSNYYYPSLMKLGLRTIHESKKNTIPHLALNLNVFGRTNDPFAMKLQYIQPRGKQQPQQQQQQQQQQQLTSQTEVSISTNNILTRRPRYRFQALFTRALSQFSLFSTGIQIDSFKGLAWLFKWQKGDVCINIPIHLASIVLGGDSCGTTSSTLMYHISTCYITFLSFIIDAIIGDVIHQTTNRMKKEEKNNGIDNDNHSEAQQKQEEGLLSSLSLDKAKKDAELQMQLMKRKSDMNRKEQEKKNGLVIVRAMYATQASSSSNSNPGTSTNMNNGTSLDVTIQLQFWVSDSKLILTSSSKSHMLGFYDVTKYSASSSSSSLVGENNDDTNEIHDSIRSRSVWGQFSLLDLWDSWFCDDPTKDEEKQKREIPFLMIRYKFNGALYDISIWDNEALTLPSPRAVKVIEEVE